ncbi:winged helix-turn-helix domain-containing protein [Enterococcus rivorum]|uniref:OmpR/PhoB-type domain-containing protein n=1 Tax=Enterococcus rivorum TaxID=762845 RepID=A0A1E5KWQ8_9ENTE|nr:winged helix-turn-helix domain-containing protein [Enterococcus rivorum]MBP2097352.1 two-component system response regulator VicR [Enterococcus rivorum]OEH82303.1 hypothetical protein BCR26_02400 [Enterococcus rivorum]
MYKIGLFDNFFKEEEENSSFNSCEFIFLKKEKFQIDLLTLDGITLYYENENEKAMTYEQIITIQSVCRLPIWVVSTIMTDEEKLVLLKLGVFVEKTLSKQELSLNIMNTLRLVGTKKKSENHPISVELRLPNSSDIQLNLSSLSIVFKDFPEIYLTKLECQLFNVLVERENSTATYDELGRTLWEYEQKTSRENKVTNVVFHIRQKLRKNNVNPDFIRTIRSVGYMLDTEILNKQSRAI